MKNLLYLPVLFMFLPAFCIPFGGKPVLLFFVLLVFSFVVLLIFSSKYVLKHIVQLYKKTSYKYFVNWVLWVLLSGLLLVVFGKYHVNRYIYYMILYLLINMVLPLLLPTFIIKNEKSFFEIVKLIFICIYIIFILGIINYIGINFSIKPILDFFVFIVNQRAFTGVATAVQYSTKVFSVFVEPNLFAGFICIFLPIIYLLSASKYTIFKNRYINFITKKTIFPLAIINLILTHSPIYLVVGVIISFCIVIHRNLSKVKKNMNRFFIIICSIILFSLFGFYKIANSTEDSDNKYLSRIKITIQAIYNLDYDYLALNEESLASRITSYYNSIRLFKKYPITGVGLGNAKHYMAQIYISSPILLTRENMDCLKKSYTTGRLNFNSAFVYELLAETGIVGFLLYYFFVWKTYTRLKKIKEYYNGILYDFICGLQNFYILLFTIFAIYNTGLIDIPIWFLLGTSIAISNIPNKSILIIRRENKNE